MNEFLTRVSEGDSYEVVIPAGSNFTEQTDVYAKDFMKCLEETESGKTRVVTIVKECEVDIRAQMAIYAQRFKAHLAHAVSQMQSKYEDELLRLKQLVRDNMLGKSFKELLQRVSEKGWIIIMQGPKAIAYYQYKPHAFPVVTERFGNGRIVEYEEPICQLASISIDLSYTKLCNEAIKIVCAVNTHPNVDGTQACSGNLDGRPVDLSNLDALVDLLDEIKTTYESAHGDSAYRTDYRSLPMKADKSAGVIDLSQPEPVILDADNDRNDRNDSGRDGESDEDDDD